MASLPMWAGEPEALNENPQPECTPFLQEKSKTISQGDPQWWHKQSLSIYDEGDYELWDSLRTVDGCDSVYHLMLHVLPAPLQEGYLPIWICSGDSVQYGDSVWYAEGTYTYPEQEKSRLRGDSVTYVIIRHHEKYYIDKSKTISQGEQQWWRKQSLSIYDEGDYELWDSLRTVDGCDSVYHLTLHVTAPILQETWNTVWVCPNEPYTYKDSTWTLPGEYAYLEQEKSRFRGDSITHIAIYNFSSFAFEEELTILERETQTWHSYLLDTFPVGEYVLWDSLHTIYGCDSIYRLALTVQQRPITRDTLTAFICYGDSVEMVGDWLKSDTTDSVVLPRCNYIQGDSIVYRNVHVWESPIVEYYDTVPEGTSKVWYSSFLGYLPPGDSTLNCNYPFTTIHGCDSVEILHVHVIPTTYIDTSAVLCQGETFTFDNVTYTKSGTYSYRHHHEHDGDTVVTVNVAIYPKYDIELQYTMSYGDSVEWQGQFITRTPGIYVLRDTSSSQYGCDSLTTLKLTVDKATQEIIWNPEQLSVPMMDSLLLEATATSGLPVTFMTLTPEYAIVEDSILIGVKRGLSMVEASQEGNAYYYPATSVRYMFMVTEGQVGWQDIKSSASSVHKVLYRDRLYIVRDGHIYTTEGHLVDIE